MTDDDLDKLIENLKSDDEDIRSSVAEALGKIGAERAVEPLIELLEDEDEDVRETAAEALGKISDKRAVEPLIEALEGGNPHDYLRKYAAKALGEIGDDRANRHGIWFSISGEHQEQLINKLFFDSEDVRYAAAEALDKLGWKPETYEQMAAYLIAKDEWKKIVKSGKDVMEYALDMLIENLENLVYDDIRENAARGLGEIGDTIAVEPLIELLDDRKYGVRDAAKEALKKLGHEVR